MPMRFDSLGEVFSLLESLRYGDKNSMGSVESQLQVARETIDIIEVRTR